MPTLESVTVHQLAALVAVEREAADRYRRATAAVYTARLLYRIEEARYRTAAAEEDASMRAMVAAQVEVDEALRALSYSRGGVMPLA